MGIASGIGFWLRQRQSEKIAAALVDRFNHRLFIWWMMLGILVIGFLLSRIGTVILFGMVSFWALREFITMTNTRRGDHRALFSVFFIFTPLQYILVALGDRTGESWWAIDFYAIFAIMIPVYASVFIPARIAINGDTKRFLERTAKIQAGLLVCVYSLSYAPALLDLNLETSNSVPWTGSRVNLLVFLVVCAQLAGVFERVWSRALGRTVVAQHVNGSRTWEGFLGSVITTGIVGATLAWATPFHWAESIMLAMVIATMAFAGGMTMSAIKRDRGVGDTGSLVQGHAGVLDQIDNVCFAAPVFYHLTRAFFT
ncbi:MAG: phosphatidate cytidylyltransferase [Planctomycetota bacterium]